MFSFVWHVTHLTLTFTGSVWPPCPTCQIIFLFSLSSLSLNAIAAGQPVQQTTENYKTIRYVVGSQRKKRFSRLSVVHHTKSEPRKQMLIILLTIDQKKLVCWLCNCCVTLPNNKPVQFLSNPANKPQISFCSFSCYPANAQICFCSFSSTCLHKKEKSKLWRPHGTANKIWNCIFFTQSC